MHDIFKVARGFPLPPPEIRIPTVPRSYTPIKNRPRNGGGLYGGRPEYYDGRPNRPMPYGKHVGIEEGWIPGRGFGMEMVNPGHSDVRYGKLPYRGISNHMSEHMVENEDAEVLSHCGGDCGRGEFLCLTSCTCIKEADR